MLSKIIKFVKKYFFVIMSVVMAILFLVSLMKIHSMLDAEKPLIFENFD